MRDQNDITTAVDELLMLWPALCAALAKDSGPSGDERVSGAGGVDPGAPVNGTVLSALATVHREVPSVARWCCSILGEPHRSTRDVPGHLRLMPVWWARLIATNAEEHARRLDEYVAQWLGLARDALGLVVPDRALPEYCPVHDDPLTRLVVPAYRGWITRDRNGVGVTWNRAEAVLCRTCGTTWTPSTYLLLGRLLRYADQRRIAAGAEGVPA